MSQCPQALMQDMMTPISASVFGVVGETAPDPVAEIAR